MTRTLDAILDWISPGRIERPSLPPWEGGLRPNERLDQARVLACTEPFQLDDVTIHRGQLVASTGDRLMIVEDGGLTGMVRLPGRCGPVLSDDDRLVVAVDGHGLYAVDAGGSATALIDDASVRDGVTDISRRAGGSLLVSVCSTRWPLDRWSDALLERDRSGFVVRVEGDKATQVVEGLAWPAGVAPSADGFAVTESLASRVCIVDEREQVVPLVTNLPAYPGRLRASADGWWVVAPYPRNRLTELLLTEPDVIAEMREQVEPELWMVPRLGSRQVIREPLQHGERRVLGQIRPWAPTSSYGLVFHVDRRGQITESLHSRADGHTHGITGVCATDGRSVVLAARGAGKIIEAEVSS